MRKHQSPLQLPGKHTNLRAVWRLVREFRDGYLHLACAVPVTMLRGALFLLVCFEVASLLEVCPQLLHLAIHSVPPKVSTAPSEQLSEQVFIVACIYVALIIVKTMFESVGVCALNSVHFLSHPIHL